MAENAANHGCRYMPALLLQENYQLVLTPTRVLFSCLEDCLHLVSTPGGPAGSPRPPGPFLKALNALQLRPALPTVQSSPGDSDDPAGFAAGHPLLTHRTKATYVTGSFPGIVTELRVTQFGATSTGPNSPKEMALYSSLYCLTCI